MRNNRPAPSKECRIPADAAIVGRTEAKAGNHLHDEDLLAYAGGTRDELIGPTQHCAPP